MSLTEKTTLEYVAGLAKPEAIELEGRPYTTAKVHPVATPLPECMVIHTLTGVRDYLVENIDGLELDRLLIQVLTPKVVRVRSRLTGPFEDRACYLTANHEQPEFQFGKYYDIESFIIELQSKFVQDDMTANILQLVGNITDDMINIYADDGITQQVNTKNGVGMKEGRPVPNPVVLSPRRTFNEIFQPEGRFVFRLKSGSGSTTGRPLVALFEADGGMWELKAIEFIRKWLRDNVPEDVTIIA